MSFELIAAGLLIPFAGTVLGAACVFLTKDKLKDGMQRALTGFAAGIMVAASIWSLLIPAMNHAAPLGVWAFVPAVAGFWAGILFLLALDHLIPHLHLNSNQAEGPQSTLPKTAKMVLAVTIHNIPEGLAVGVVYAGYMSGSVEIAAGGALAMSLGIAIQNFPEGAIVSLPVKAEGLSKAKSFGMGVLSGVVEPAFAFLAVAATGVIAPVIPFLLAFAAGAMIYVVVEELIPEMSAGQHSHTGVLLFAVGFTLMMALDVALG